MIKTDSEIFLRMSSEEQKQMIKSEKLQIFLSLLVLHLWLFMIIYAFKNGHFYIGLILLFITSFYILYNIAIKQNIT